MKQQDSKAPVMDSPTRDLHLWALVLWIVSFGSLNAEPCLGTTERELAAIYGMPLIVRQRKGILEKFCLYRSAEYDIQVKYNGSTPWTLYAPQHKGTYVEWQRIAECFRPVYAKAQKKWEPA